MHRIHCPYYVPLAELWLMEGLLVEGLFVEGLFVEGLLVGGSLVEVLQVKWKGYK